MFTLNTHEIAHRQKLRQDLFDRSLFQWLLIRSIAFAERDWIVIATLLFALDPAHDFWTMSGLLFFMAGIFTIGPIGGMVMYTSARLVFFWRRSHGQPVATIKDVKVMTWAINIFWLPWMAVTGRFCYGLYMDAIASLPATRF